MAANRATLHQDRPGRWRCLLCPRGQRHWRKGTLRDSTHHYRILHAKETHR